MQSALKSQRPARAYRVLAVDDDPRSTELTRIALENSGSYVVREVNDAHAAIAEAQEFMPDLIIMDVDMPRLDGRAAALLIQCKEGLSDVPILFVTSMIPETAGKNEFGWLGPLAKPVAPKTLVHTVETILRDRTLHCPNP
jgi:CheY-like chemotaxis protein